MSDPSLAFIPLDRGRSFRIGDGMILVATAAICCAFGRMAWEFFAIRFDKRIQLTNELIQFGEPPGPDARYAGSLALHVILVLIVSSLIWMVAFLVLRLIRPRPPMRPIAQQPGSVAVAAMLAGSIVAIVPPWHLFTSKVVDTMTLRLGILAASVPLAWLALAIAGRWRPERSWIDRLGGAIGLCWSLLIAAYIAISRALL